MGQDFIWTPVGTDITLRWRLEGWVPPSECPQIKAKWKFFQELPFRSLDEKGKREYEHRLRQAKVARIK